MIWLVQIVVSVASLSLSVLQLLMFARALLSWLPFDEDSPLQKFLIVTTEPIIFPVRNLLGRIRFFNESPIDFSFTFAFLLLTVVQMFLPQVIF